MLTADPGEVWFVEPDVTDTAAIVDWSQILAKGL
jgi:hypothetical protein